MKKRILTIPRLIVLFVLLIIATMGVWLALRSIIATGMTTTISNLEQQGYEIGHGGLAVSGFPFVVDARTQNVSVQAPSSIDPDPSKNWSLRTDELDLYSSTFTPLSWSARHGGDMRIDMRGIDGERYMFDIAPAKIFADVTVGLNGKVKHLRTDISRTRINSLVGAEPPILALGGARANLDVKGDEGHIDFLAKDVILTEKYLGIANSILGRDLSRVSIIARIENWALLEAGRNDEWLESPARIKSEDWQILWGNIDIVGDLDIGFQNRLPAGTITFKIKNADRLVEELATAGIMPLEISSAAALVVSNLDADENERKAIVIQVRNGALVFFGQELYRF